MPIWLKTCSKTLLSAQLRLVFVSFFKSTTSFLHSAELMESPYIMVSVFTSIFILNNSELVGLDISRFYILQALEKYNIEKDIAAYIKKEFDKKYNPTWHCIVGRNFGSYVTHETKHFIYFYLGQVAILLFKSG